VVSEHVKGARWALSKGRGEIAVGLISVLIPDITENAALREQLSVGVDPHGVSTQPQALRFWGEMLTAGAAPQRAATGLLSAALAAGDGMTAAHAAALLVAHPGGQAAVSEALLHGLRHLLQHPRPWEFTALLACVAGFSPEDGWSAAARVLAETVLSGPAAGAAALASVPHATEFARALAVAAWLMPQARWGEALAAWCSLAEAELPPAERKHASTQMLAIVGYIDPPRDAAPGHLSLAQLLAVLPDSRNKQYVLAHRYRFVCLAPQQRVLYTKIGKAACTSMAYVIWKLNGGPDLAPADVAQLHAPSPFLPRLGKLEPARIAEVLADPSWFRFTVIRHPIRRFLAAYVNKFLYKADGMGLFTRAAAVFDGHPWLLPAWQRGPVSLDGVVRLLASIGPGDADPHFLPQAVCALRQDIPYDRVVKLEDAQHAFPALMERVGFDGAVPRLDMHTSRVYAERVRDALVASPLLATLQRFYAADCALFDYAPEDF